MNVCNRKVSSFQPFDGGDFPISSDAGVLPVECECEMSFFTLEGDEQKVLCVKIFFLVQKIVLILLNNCNPKTTELWNMP